MRKINNPAKLSADTHKEAATMKMRTASVLTKAETMLKLFEVFAVPEHRQEARWGVYVHLERGRQEHMLTVSGNFKEISVQSARLDVLYTCAAGSKLNQGESLNKVSLVNVYLFWIVSY